MFVFFVFILWPMESKIEIHQMVKELLDGRTQRWLSNKIGVYEADLSKKMNGKMKFTDIEIEKISALFGVSIEAKAEKP